MSVIEVNEASFEAEVLNSPVPVLLDFYTATCGPCRRMVPVLEGLAQSLAGRARVVKIDATENPNLAVEFNVVVVPTFVVVKDGREVNRLTGVASASRLLEAMSGAG